MFWAASMDFFFSFTESALDAYDVQDKLISTQSLTVSLLFHTA